jgi:hypothetical protein
MTATILSECLGDDIAAARALVEVETDPADQLLVDDLPGSSDFNTWPTAWYDHPKH